MPWRPRCRTANSLRADDSARTASSIAPAVPVLPVGGLEHLQPQAAQQMRYQGPVVGHVVDHKHPASRAFVAADRALSVHPASPARRGHLVPSVARQHAARAGRALSAPAPDVADRDGLPARIQRSGQLHAGLQALVRVDAGAVPQPQRYAAAAAGCGRLRAAVIPRSAEGRRGRGSSCSGARFEATVAPANAGAPG